LIKPEQRLSAYRWSSYPAYLLPPRKRPAWLRGDRLLGEHGIPKDSKPGRRHFAAAMEARREGEAKEEFKGIRRGWYLGDKAFRKELLEQMAGRRGKDDYGEEHFEADEEQALRILTQELKRRRWTEKQMGSIRKGDPQKVAIAQCLRQETTMSYQWIAEKLAMGSWSNVSNLLGAKRRAK
jgi:hypothetical protein